MVEGEKEHSMSKLHQDYLAKTYFSENAFDKGEFERFSKLVNGVKRFIDVGASHGVYTYHANRLLHDADIYCIEADPERYEILLENTAKWSQSSTNRIHCIAAAASDEDDREKNPEITFYTTGTQISGGLFSVNERSDDYAPRKVKLVTVDDFYVSPDVKTFVKIDVEGAELRVLKGSLKHIRGQNTVFFTEIAWWGDRDRSTSALDVLRFAYDNNLRVDRRLKSDYLLSPEKDARARLESVMRCLPPLAIRFGWNTFVPRQVRTWKERRENAKRLARFGDAIAR